MRRRHHLLRHRINRLLSASGGIAVSEQLEPRRLLSTASVVRDIIPGTASSVSFNSSNNTEIALGNKFIFVANDGLHGMEPFVSDGSEANTQMLADINSGSDSSDPNGFTLGDGVAYFLARPSSSSPSIQVWKTDGTPAHTVPVSTLAMGNDRGIAEDLAYSNGKLYIAERGNLTSSLWVSDGTSAGTFLTDTNDISAFGASTGGNLFFSVADDNGTDQVWFSNGTPSGTTQVTNFPTYGAFIAPNEDNFINGQFLFDEAQPNGDGTTDEFLWRTNGNPINTTQFGPGFFTVSPNDLTLSGGTIYFSGGESSSTGNQIYSTDGTSVRKITSLATSPDTIRDLTDVNGTLYFTASISGGTRQLFMLSNGTATPVPLASDGGGTNPGDLQNVNGTLFYSGLTTTGQATLYETNGTTTSVVGGDPGTDPAGLLNVNGTLFYAADDPTTGTELHQAVAATPLSLSLGPHQTINEGDTASFRATLTGGTIKKILWDFEGNGVFVKARADASHTYALPGEIEVHARVYTNDGRQIRGSVFLTVNNVDPKVNSLKAAVTLPGIGKLPLKFAAVPYLPITFTAAFTDPGPKDTFTADWTFSDGTTATQNLDTARTASIPHQFKTTGAAWGSVKITDQAGGHDGDTTYFVITPLSTTTTKLGVDYLIGETRGKHKVFLKSVQSGIELFIDGVAQHPLIKHASEIIAVAGPLEDLVIDPAIKKITSVIQSKK
ncbi:MAG: PKD domain-containing protein [Phycisphaerae bacterium]|nr:PKD domain-containing protein [Phycisphaerae bacterium]